MKKLIIALAISCLAFTAFAQNSAVVVSNTSTMIMPPRGRMHRPTTTYTNDQAVPQGAIWYRAPATRFWAVNNGFATNQAPAGMSGDFTTNSVVWRVIPPAERRGATLINASSNVVFLSFYGGPAELNKGGVLSQKYSTYMLDQSVLQNAIYAICADPTGSVYVMEW